MGTLSDAAATDPPALEVTLPAPVVGGEPAEEGAWPDAVALFTATQFACSGVLVAPDVVLTAGHCGYGMDHVVVGAVDYATGGRAIPIVDHAVHEDYLHTLDVAVMWLAEPIDDIAPRLLARDCVIDDDLYAGAEVEIVGFGATDPYGLEATTALHHARSVVDDPLCTAVDLGCNEEVSPGGELVAGGDGVDSCVGDSGGPLYLLGSHGDVLVGITSRGTFGADTMCGDGGIYVRADAIADWLGDELGVDLPRPECDGNRAPHPTAPELTVVAGERAEARVDAGDPDAGQLHTFAIVDPPAHGAATIDAAGVLTYDATGVDPGWDRLTVTVSDDGAPPRTGVVDVDLHVIPVPAGTLVAPAPRGCGCGTSGSAGASAAWTALLAALTAGRRARTSRAASAR